MMPKLREKVTLVYMHKSSAYHTTVTGYGSTGTFGVREPADGDFGAAHENFEGITWLRGWPDLNSEEVKAMLAARALRW